MSNLIKTDKAYKNWISDVSKRFRQQPADDLAISENRQQAVDDSEMQLIFRIPWGHHTILLNKCKGNQQKALFYVKKTIENNWSRAVLQNQLSSNLYEREGKALTNFAQYALESSSQPLGISSYELSKLVPEKFKGSMPTIEEIEAELMDTASDSEDEEGGEDA